MKMKTLLPSFMLFACTFQTIALNSETQNTIIKLEQSVISVGQLITQIENQTDYLVVFKSREVDIERYITVQNTSGKMISYLEEAFKDINPAKRKAMAVKNEKRFLKQKRNALKNPGYSRHPVKTQASFKRLLKAV